jgi:alkylhydroperoxidase family enzyme
VTGRQAWLAAVALAGAVGAAPPSAAHTLSPEAIVAEIGGEAARREAGVASAARDARLPRLLVVRVTPTWGALSAERRAALAAAWWTAWRHAVPQGIVAILDAADDRSLVSFAVDGTPRLAAPGGQGRR